MYVHFDHVFVMYNSFYRVERKKKKDILMLLYVSAALYMSSVVLLLDMICDVCGLVPAVFNGGL